LRRVPAQIRLAPIRDEHQNDRRQDDLGEQCSQAMQVEQSGEILDQYAEQDGKGDQCVRQMAGVGAGQVSEHVRQRHRDQAQQEYGPAFQPPGKGHVPEQDGQPTGDQQRQGEDADVA